MRALYRGLLALWIHLQRKGAEMGRRRAERFLAMRYLHELDARTLKDIGLEAWRSPLGAEIEHRRQSRRWDYTARAGL